MSLSFNEIEALASKAARGAGLGWGLAEEAGAAARWLAERGFDWAEALLDRLRQRVSDDLVIGDGMLRGEVLCPLRCGAYLADSGVASGGIVLDAVAVPTLLLPFVARSASAPLEMQIGDGVVVRVAGDVVSYSPAGMTLPTAAIVRVRLCDPASVGLGQALPLLSRPRAITSAQAEALGAFERKTYVPASAQSRLAGAGAGLSDND
jgi:hypothetical protein